MTVRNPKRTRRIVGAIAAAVVAAGAGVAAAPRPPSLSTEISGDADLAARVVEALESTGEGAVRDRLVVVEIDGDETTFAGFGADERTTFEIGSVTKTLTAALFADAIARGEVAPDQTVGDLLDVGDAPVADVRLDELASHRSGLPSIPADMGLSPGAIIARLANADPYPQDDGALLDAARSAELTGRGEVAYSNMGMALLGLAVAGGAGGDYPDLLRERVLEPIGLERASVPTSPGDLPDGHETGSTANGRHADAWTLGDYAPAGAARADADDMAVYARAMLDRAEPFATSLEPRWDEEDGQRVGYAWFTSEVPVDRGDPDSAVREITWHNGMTGGFATHLALDLEADRAVLIMSDVARSVDMTAFALVTEAGR